MGEGSMLVTKSEISYLAAIDVKIIDTVGAGDASLHLLFLLQMEYLNQIHHKAVEIASLVCSKMGECQLQLNLLTQSI